MDSVLVLFGLQVILDGMPQSVRTVSLRTGTAVHVLVGDDAYDQSHRDACCNLRSDRELDFSDMSC